MRHSSWRDNVAMKTASNLIELENHTDDEYANVLGNTEIKSTPNPFPPSLTPCRFNTPHLGLASLLTFTPTLWKGETDGRDVWVS